MKIDLNNNDTNLKQICIKFEAFKQEIRKILKVFNEKQSVEKTIQYLIQRTLIVEYVAQFQKQTNLIK